MNRFICKVENGKLKPISVTSKPPKDALVDYINNKYSISKSDIKKSITKQGNAYYIGINGETFKITR